MFSDPRGGVIFISEFAVDKSDCLRNIPFPEERKSLFLSITDCQLRVMRLRSSRAEKKYTNRRLFRVFIGWSRLQEKISSSVLFVIVLVNIRTSFRHSVNKLICEIGRAHV